MSVELSALIYTLVLLFLTFANYAYWHDIEKPPPWWLLVPWAVFAVPLLVKAWAAVVLS